MTKINTVSYGMESLRYRGPLTWEIVSYNIKESTSLDIFKRKIKAWKPQGCTCRLCKTYIYFHIIFIWPIVHIFIFFILRTYLYLY